MVEVLPAGTVAEAGTVTPCAVLSLESETTRPPTGAGLEMPIVLTADKPPVTPVGAICSERSIGAVTVSTADSVLELALAVIVAEIFEATAVVVIVYDAIVCPAATVTVAGTVTPLATLSLASEIVMPPAGAEFDRYT